MATRLKKKKTEAHPSLRYEEMDFFFFFKAATFVLKN